MAFSGRFGERKPRRYLDYGAWTDGQSGRASSQKALARRTQWASTSTAALVDELKGANIEPFATLHHWDAPQAMQDRSVASSRAIRPKAFGDYPGYVADKRSDRIRHFITLNEPSTFVEHEHTAHGSDVCARLFRQHSEVVFP